MTTTPSSSYTYSYLTRPRYRGRGETCVPSVPSPPDHRWASRLYEHYAQFFPEELPFIVGSSSYHEGGATNTAKTASSNDKGKEPITSPPSQPIITPTRADQTARTTSSQTSGVPNTQGAPTPPPAPLPPNPSPSQTSLRSTKRSNPTVPEPAPVHPEVQIFKSLNQQYLKEKHDLAERFKKERESLHAQLATLTSERDQLRSKHDTLSASYIELEKEKEKLEENLKTANAKLDIAVRSRKTIADDKVRLEREKRDLERKVTDVQATLDKKVKKNQDLVKEGDQLVITHNNLVRDHNQLRDLHTTLNQRLRTLTEEQNARQQQLQELETQLATLQAAATQPLPTDVEPQAPSIDMATSPSPDPSREVVLYNPQAFDVVMRDAPEIEVITDREGALANPPEWILAMGHALKTAHDQIREIKREAKQEAQKNTELLKVQYEDMRSVYTSALSNLRLGMTIDTIQFQKRVERDARTFGQEVQRTLAQYHRNELKRNEYVEQLFAAVQRLEANNDTLGQVVQDTRTTQGAIINDLNAIRSNVVGPQDLDEYAKRQEAHLQAMMNEVRKEFANGLNPLQAFQNVARRATSIAPTNTARSSTFVSRPASQSVPRTTIEADPVSARSLRMSQAERTSAHAQHNYDAARSGAFNSGPPPMPGGPYMSGGAGGPPRNNPPFGAPGGYPDDDPDDDDPDRRGGGFDGGPPPRRPPAVGPASHPAGAALFAQVNPVQLNKPSTYSGRDLALFKPWWSSVLAYIRSYEASFYDDQIKIAWVGSLLTDKARIWHQQRQDNAMRQGWEDNWNAYSAHLAERFRDPSERFRAMEKMKKLEYKNDITQFMTELRDYNDVVQWSGVTLQTHISRALPQEITKMVYSRKGYVPEVDSEFIEAIEEAGRIYENMLANPAISGKGKPGSTPEHSRSGQPRKDTSSRSGQSSSGGDKQSGGSKPDRGKEKQKVWASNRDALKGIDQSDIDKRKTAKKACWRCGRDNHSTLSCFAKKDANGKDLPPAPDKVSSTSTKRKSDDSELPTPAATPPNKKARVDAVKDIPALTDHDVDELIRDRIFEEVSDSEEEDF